MKDASAGEQDRASPLKTGKALRERVLSAAFRLFLERGFSQTSMLEIATRAQVSKRDLYALYDNKIALLADGIGKRAQGMRRLLGSTMPVPPNRKALAAALALASPAWADFSSCVAALRADGARTGVSRETLDAAFNGLQPDMKVLDFEKQQPEFKTPIWDYVEGLVDEERVNDGKAAMAKNAHALARAEETYGVSRYMLAAIWGVESNFGTEMGNRPLVQSLSTLACMGARPAYFRSELMAALKIIDRGDIPADKLAGSWAGAFGQTQFMPSSYLRLAVAGGSGRRTSLGLPPLTCMASAPRSIAGSSSDPVYSAVPSR